MIDSLQLGRRRFLLGAVSTAGLAAGPSWLGCVGSLQRGTPPADVEAARAALARACAWLWAEQREDGRFASRVYGLLAGGQSLTPFVLDSLLLHQREAAGFADPVAREGSVAALAAMTRMRNADGALGFAGPALDYPCYATGLFLSCLGAFRPAGWRALAEPSVAWLREQQLRSERGWQDHPAQGGWGMGDRSVRKPPNAGHVDLSMTRRVVMGLRAVGVPADDPALVEARDFAARCQTGDGSFVYSPVELALNKGLRAPDGSPRGYGSATSDGLLSLDALGLATGEGSGPGLEAGLDWLRRNHSPDRNPGLDGGPMEAFAQAMRGYYRAGSARCFARWGGPPGWQQELSRQLVVEQRDDGSFLGTSPLQKEDDPLIATAFAVQALASVLAPG